MIVASYVLAGWRGLWISCDSVMGSPRMLRCARLCTILTVKNVGPKERKSRVIDRNWGDAEVVFNRGSLFQPSMEWKLTLPQCSLYKYFPKSRSFRCLKGRQPIYWSRSDEECDSFTVNHALAQLSRSLWKAIYKRTKEKMGPGTPSMLMHFLFHKFTVRCT